MYFKVILSCMTIFERLSVKINLRGFRHKPVTLSCENLCRQNRNEYCLNQTKTGCYRQCFIRPPHGVEHSTEVEKECRLVS